VRRKVVFGPEAEADLLDIYDFIAARSGSKTALSYVDRIGTYCRGFADFPERGTRRDDLWPGLCIIGFERRVTIALQVKPDTVRIIRILYGGRDLKAAISGIV
jgi:toxin ParE1/3/4